MAIRKAGDGGKGAEDGADPEVNAYEVFEGDQVSVLCAEELAELCQDLDLIVSTTVPAVRAVRRGPGRAPPHVPAAVDDLPPRWAAPVKDAEQAHSRYRRALLRCPKGPLRNRLEEAESDFLESVAGCAELARWGAEAEGARGELDPEAVRRGAGRIGDQAGFAAEDQREVIDRLEAVMHEAKARLVLINGRLDEAVGRAVEMAGRAGRVGRGGTGGPDVGAGELATDLRALRAALDEMDGLRVDRLDTKGLDPPRRATSAD